MKRLIVLSFIFFLGCNLFQLREDEECFPLTFSKFKITSEGLNTIKADVIVSISNTSNSKIYLDATDLYVDFDGTTLTRIATNLKKEIGYIAPKSKKNFRFRISFKNTDTISRLTWGNSQSKLLLAGLVYYKFSKYPTYSSKCIVSTYRVR